MIRSATSGRDRRLATALIAWFAERARPFPWRTSPRDPFASLVSEVMLQQTQAARAAERFPLFMARFPDVASLARAPLDDVLALWSGLGYYRRARLLHEAARAIISDHAGLIPSDPALLRTLPGIGEYTAGAIASMVFDQPIPAVDGNIARVMSRLDAIDGIHASPELLTHARARAAALLRHASPALLNEGLMELGASVCTPRAPKCGECPLRSGCLAHAHGLADSIPRPKPAPARSILHCQSVLITWRGRTLIERRPDHGLWAGLWQAPTLEAPRLTRRTFESWLGHNHLDPIDRFRHATTHREIRFRIWRARDLDAARAKALATDRHDRRWVRSLEGLALASPQRRILALA